jgi:opacity protein-like surface antigen
MNAQSEQKFHFGLKAAPSLAWITTDTKGFESSGTKLGFSYGLITEFNFTPNYAFATGVDITYRGGNSKYSFKANDSTTTNIEEKYNLQYVEIPLTLKLKTNEIGYLTYFLQFGVAPGFNIRAKSDRKITTQTGSNISTESEDNVDIKDDINNFNLSMIIAGGLEYTLSGSTVLLAGITFNNGFLDILDDSAIKANSDYLALTVGVLF